MLFHVLDVTCEIVTGCSFHRVVLIILDERCRLSEYVCMLMYDDVDVWFVHYVLIG
jgi:hypothetical protein